MACTDANTTVVHGNQALRLYYGTPLSYAGRQAGPATGSALAAYMNALFDTLRTCPALELRALSEPGSHKLCLLLAEAEAEDGGLHRLASLGRPPAAPALPAPARVFELLWPSYVGYTVLNEVYVSADRYECYEGRLLVEYSRSHYMDYLSAASFATTEYPGPIRHWGLFCVDHVINIASTEAPRIRLLDQAP